MSDALVNTTKKERKISLAFERHLKRFNKRIKFFRTTLLNEVDPGSPVFLNPEPYRVRLSRRHFKDFYLDHSRQKSSFGFKNSENTASCKQQIFVYTRGLYALFFYWLIVFPFFELFLKCYILICNKRHIKKNYLVKRRSGSRGISTYEFKRIN